MHHSVIDIIQVQSVVDPVFSCLLRIANFLWYNTLPTLVTDYWPHFRRRLHFFPPDSAKSVNFAIPFCYNSQKNRLS